MSWLERIFRRRKLNDELSEELQGHIEERTEQLIRLEGLAQARIVFGRHKAGLSPIDKGARFRRHSSTYPGHRHRRQHSSIQCCGWRAFEAASLPKFRPAGLPVAAGSRGRYG